MAGPRVLSENRYVLKLGDLALRDASESLTLGTPLGVGVTPGEWDASTGSAAVQIGARAALSAVVNGASTQLTNNSRFDGTNHKYLETAAASFYAQGSGVHQWGNAASGTAGNTITYTVRMTLDASGNLGIGTSAFGTSAAGVLALANSTAPTTGPANTVQLYSTDLSAGNTIPSLFCEGSGVIGTSRIAIRVNGTVYYLLAKTTDDYAPSFTAVEGGVGFQNSWVNYGSGFQTAGFWKDSFGIVRLRGNVKSGTTNATIFTLPVGYRPAAAEIFGPYDGATVLSIYVLANGSVIHQGPNNTLIPLNNVWFVAA